MSIQCNGRTNHGLADGRYEGLVYLESTADNRYIPALPQEAVDLIYLCFPNNPTGSMITADQLRLWVDYARENKALILYDAAYVEFIRDDSLPQSIYEIDGAKEVAVEFRSLSRPPALPEHAAPTPSCPESARCTTPRARLMRSTRSGTGASQQNSQRLLSGAACGRGRLLA